MSTFYNYKGYHSILLLALVDAGYKFTAIDVGSYWKNSDCGIFSKSTIRIILENKTLNIPEDVPLVIECHSHTSFSVMKHILSIDIYFVPIVGAI